MTSMIGPEIMEKNNSEAIQYISSTAFFPRQHYNNLECPTLRCSQLYDSKHIQEPPRCTLGRQPHRSAGQLVTRMMFPA